MITTAFVFRASKRDGVFPVSPGRAKSLLRLEGAEKIPPHLHFDTSLLSPGIVVFSEAFSPMKMHGKTAEKEEVEV